MQSKLEVLKMLEKQELTAEEALALIEAIDQTEAIDDQNSTLLPEEIFASQTDEPTSYKRIDASLVSCKLNIEKSLVDDVTIEILDEKTRAFIKKPDWLLFSEEGDTIYIKEKRTEGLNDVFEFIKNSADIMKTSVFVNIKLPMDTILRQATISGVSSNLSMIGVNAIEGTFKNVSGNIQIIQSKVKQLKARSIAGNIIIDDVKVSSGNYNATSGKIKINGSYEAIVFKSVSGQVNIEDSKGLKSIDGQTVSGKIEVYLDSPEQYNMALDNKVGKIDTSGFAVVEKHTSGRHTVNVTKRSKAYQLTIKSISGKIIIDQIEQ